MPDARRCIRSAQAGERDCLPGGFIGSTANLVTLVKKTFQTVTPSI